MTRELSTPLATFVAKLRQRHPTLEVSCDVPDLPTGSTWIDIKVGVDCMIVEYHPDFGFGLTDPRDRDGHLYGSPSSRFVGTTEEALEDVDRMLLDLVSPAQAAQRGA